MNLTDTARLLTMIASFNNRTIGEADVTAWQSVLPDVPLADAEEAARRHYAENTDWLMPAHVRRIVRDIHAEREAMARATGWAPGQAGVPKDRPMPEVTGPIDDGNLAPEVKAKLRKLLCERFGEPDRAKLMPRETYWQRECAAYQRGRNAVPNPHYRPQEAESRCPGGYEGCRPEAPCAVGLPTSHWWAA